MRTNLLIAINNLIRNPAVELISPGAGNNRANNMGDALELYIKDLFCNSMGESSMARKNEIYGEYFSYCGNKNNPPDIIIKRGDAIEVKKIENLRSQIALNSSYPKDKLCYDSPMITAGCRDCEGEIWQKKDMVYVIGVTEGNRLKTLWFVYGDCYAANKETYERIKNKIAGGLEGLEGVEFSKTKELGRVNAVDPLGITYLRIRGMWGIENPINVFDYIDHVDTNAGFSFNAIMLKKKYYSFPEDDIKNIEGLAGGAFSIRDVKIKSPNNTAKLLEAKLLSFRG